MTDRWKRQIAAMQEILIREGIAPARARDLACDLLTAIRKVQP